MVDLRGRRHRRLQFAGQRAQRFPAMFQQVLELLMIRVLDLQFEGGQGVLHHLTEDFHFRLGEFDVIHNFSFWLVARTKPARFPQVRPPHNTVGQQNNLHPKAEIATATQVREE